MDPGRLTWCGHQSIRSQVQTAESITAPPMVSIRVVTSAEDLTYAAAKFSEDYKYSPEARGMSYATYKRLIVPDLCAAIRRRDTRVIGAYIGRHLVGFLAYQPGRRVTTVHWLRVRTGLGRPPETTLLRKQRIATRLVDAAQLGDRIVYTHRGPRVRGSDETSDEWIARWLARRGQHAAFQSYQEWSR